MKKSNISFFAAMVAGVMLMAGAGNTWAETEIVDGIEWQYGVWNGIAYVAGSVYQTAIPQNTTGAITIPSMFGGYPVRGIGAWSFRNCTGLTSVTIPDSVTDIDDNAFDNCTGLTSVTIPNSVTNIGEFAFYMCTGVTSATIPQCICSSNVASYLSVDQLRTVVIANGVTNIGIAAFENLPVLTSVTIPDSVTSIGNAAFTGSTNLTSVTIGNGVTNIGAGAFWECPALTSVTFKGAPPEFGQYVFFHSNSSPLVIHAPANMGWPTKVQGVPVETREPESVTVEGVELPTEWLDEKGLRAGAATEEELKARWESKAANGRPVWECYVADLDPNNPKDDLVLSITMVEGKPLVEIISGKSPRRSYEMQGTSSMEGPWGGVDGNSRFFRAEVKVEK